MLKENYWDSIDLEGLGTEKIHDLNVSGSVLLIMDMQNFFLSPESHAFVPSSPGLIPVIMDLVFSFEQQGLPVIYTRHLNTLENAKNMGLWWRDVITEDKTLSEIHSSFDTSNSTVINKSQYDAFYKTDLQSILETLGTTTVIITGVMTNLCCETTARSAFVKGFNVLMPVDGTATVNSELHRATTINLSHGFTKPVSVASIKKSIMSLCEY